MLWGVILRTDLTVLPPLQLLALQAYTPSCPAPVVRYSLKKIKSIQSRIVLGKLKELGREEPQLLLALLFFFFLLHTLKLFITLTQFLYIIGKCIYQNL